MLKIDISKRSKKFLATLSAKQARQLALKILSLGKNPIPHDSTRLKGFDRFHRTDFGEYRIIYSLQEDMVLIVLVGKRPA